MHDGHKIDETTGDLQKSDIAFYNHTKIGVDVLDQICAEYDVSRNTKRWPMVVFFYLLNIGTVNALKVYNDNKSEGSPMPRSEFISNVTWEPIVPKIRERVCQLSWNEGQENSLE